MFGLPKRNTVLACTLLLLLITSLLAPRLGLATSSTATTSYAAVAAQHADRPAVTCYVSPTATTAGNCTRSNPSSLAAAGGLAATGAVIGLLPGTYDLPRNWVPRYSGTASDWRTIRAVEAGTVRLRYTGPLADTEAEWVTASIINLAGKSYWRVYDLVLEGQRRNGAGIQASNAHHMHFEGNTIYNVGAGGIVAQGDYFTILRNRIHGHGLVVGWSSGVTILRRTWSDRAPGFHSVVAGNVASGGWDNSHNVAGSGNTNGQPTDGNGFIVDRGGDGPWVLVANNVAYANGGRGITTFLTNNVVAVNNVTYGNGRNQMAGQRFPEIHYLDSNNLWSINNHALHGSGNAAFSSRGTNIRRVRDVAGVVGDGTLTNPHTGSFLDVWGTAPRDVPTDYEDRYRPTMTSTLDGGGMVPWQVEGLPAELHAQLRQYAATDIRGVTYNATRWDVGAYAVSTGGTAATPVPSPTLTPTTPPSTPVPSPTLTPTTPPPPTAEPTGTAGPNITIWIDGTAYPLAPGPHDVRVEVKP